MPDQYHRMVWSHWPDHVRQTFEVGSKNYYGDYSLLRVSGIAAMLSDFCNLDLSNWQLSRSNLCPRWKGKARRTRLGPLALPRTPCWNEQQAHYWCRTLATVPGIHILEIVLNADSHTSAIPVIVDVRTLVTGVRVGVNSRSSLPVADRVDSPCRWGLEPLKNRACQQV